MRARCGNLFSILVAAALLGGCGSPDRVTYVDPNPDSAYAGVGGAGDDQPFARHGVDTLVRSKALLRLRGALATARTLHALDPGAASAIVDATLVDDVAVVDPRLITAAPELAARLRAQLGSLARAGAGDDASYSTRVQRISGPLVDQVDTAVTPAPARQDPGYRAGVLAELLVDAGTAYEQAFAGGSDEIELEARYREAYGALLDARTRGLAAIPAQHRRTLQAELTKVADRAFPGPTPPDDPPEPGAVAGRIYAAADLVASAAGIDVTLPSPEATTPDQIRAIKQRVAAIVERIARDERDAARSELETVRRTQLPAVASGIAIVSTDLLVRIERLLLVDLPAATQGRGDASALGAQLDQALDEAVALVETELEQLRADSE